MKSAARKAKYSEQNTNKRTKQKWKRVMKIFKKRKSITAGELLEEGAIDPLPDQNGILQELAASNSTFQGFAREIGAKPQKVAHEETFHYAN